MSIDFEAACLTCPNSLLMDTESSIEDIFEIMTAPITMISEVQLQEIHEPHRNTTTESVKKEAATLSSPPNKAHPHPHPSVDVFSPVSRDEHGQSDFKLASQKLSQEATSFKRKADKIESVEEKMIQYMVAGVLYLESGHYTQLLLERTQIETKVKELRKQLIENNRITFDYFDFCSKKLSSQRNKELLYLSLACQTGLMTYNYELQKAEIDSALRSKSPVHVPKSFKDMDQVLRSLLLISSMHFDDITLPHKFPFCSLSDLSKLVRFYLETKGIRVPSITDLD